MESTNVNLITLLRDRVGELCGEGDFSEALDVANAAVGKAEKELSGEVDSIEAFAAALEVRGDLLRSTGEYEKARDDYRQAIDRIEGRHDLCIQLGRLHADLGAVHDELGNLEQSLGDVDGAENSFLKALEILHRELGPNNDETASVCNNLGALYLQSGYNEQARDMHLMALDARRKLFGETHIDTAQSYNNLALALLRTGDVATAKRHFESAIGALESCGPEAVEELESIRDNYLDFLRRDGADASSNQVEQRIARILAQWE